MDGFGRYGRRELLRTLIASAVVAVSVAALPPPRCAHGQAAPAETPPQASAHEFGLIETQVRQVRRPNCWTLVVRGKLRNPYDEPVSGVSLIVRLRSAGETPKDLERIETEMTSVIEPGGSVPFRRELTTDCTTRYSNISVVAFARRRGATEIPPPAKEVELEASQIQTAASAPGEIPIVNSPVAISGSPY